MKALRNENSLLLRTKLRLALALIGLLTGCGNNQPFDATVWQGGDLRRRGAMAEDLIKRKLLVGQAADDVERLLGRADKHYAGALVYNIDLGMPFKDSSGYAFIVHLDAQRKVRQAQITD